LPVRRAASIMLTAQPMAAGKYVVRASLSQAERTVRTILVNHTAPVQLNSVELILAEAPKLRVILDQRTNMARMSGMASCDPLGITAVDNQGISVAGVVGSSPRCVWRSDSMLDIFLGGYAGQPLITHSHSLCFSSAALLSAAENSKECAHCCIVSTTHSCSMQPVVVIIDAPSVVSDCGTFTVDASASYNSGGRPMTFSWSVTALNASSAAARSADRLTAQMMGSHPIVSSSALIRGFSYSVHVVVTNFLGCQSQGSVTVTVKSDPVPTMLLIGPEPVRILRSEALNLFVHVDGPCAPGGAVRYLWNSPQLSHLATISASHGTHTSRDLYVAPLSLKAQDYDFTLQATLIDQPSVSNQLDVLVKVYCAPLSADIAGGSRSISAQSSLVLDASKSRDPESPSAQLAFAWSCTGSGSSKCPLAVAATLANASIAVVTVGPFELNYSNHTMRITATVHSMGTANCGARTASTAIDVTVVQPSSPILHIRRRGNYMKAGWADYRDDLVLDGTISTTTANQSPSWSLFVESASLSRAHVTLPNASVAMKGPHTSRIRVPASFLDPGRAYAFRMYADADRSAWADYYIQTFSLSVCGSLAIYRSPWLSTAGSWTNGKQIGHLEAVLGNGVFNRIVLVANDFFQALPFRRCVPRHACSNSTTTLGACGVLTDRENASLFVECENDPNIPEVSIPPIYTFGYCKSITALAVNLRMRRLCLKSARV
jgi:hypothetical protein